MLEVLSANYGILAPPTIVAATSTVPQLFVPVNFTTPDLSIAAITAQFAAPSGPGVIALGHSGGITRQGVLLQFWGFGDDQAPLQVAVVGWRYFIPPDVSKGLWVPMPICEATATLDTNLRGVAQQWVGESELMAGSIQVTSGYGLAFNSSAYKTPAALKVPTFGCRYLQVLVGVGSMAYANGLWAACDFAEAPLPVVPPTS